MCLKNHSCNLYAPLCGIFYLHSVDMACYALCKFPSAVIYLKANKTVQSDYLQYQIYKCEVKFEYKNLTSHFFESERVGTTGHFCPRKESIQDEVQKENTRYNKLIKSSPGQRKEEKT